MAIFKTLSFLYKYNIQAGGFEMREQRPSLSNASIPVPLSLSDTAALDNFMRLQQSQEEFLAWLNTNERLAVVDRYNYRKIR